MARVAHDTGRVGNFTWLAAHADCTIKTARLRPMTMRGVTDYAG